MGFPGAGLSSFRGSGPGQGWWFASTGAQVGHGWWLERDRLMVLGAAGGVVAVAAWPMWLRWTDPSSGRALRHGPGLCQKSRTLGVHGIMPCVPARRSITDLQAQVSGGYEGKEI
jgi:hypothetical protein